MARRDTAVLYPPLDPAFLATPALPKRPVVWYVGRLSRLKGAALVLAIARHLALRSLSVEMTDLRAGSELAERTHLLAEEKVTRRGEGEMHERVLAAVGAIGAPISLNKIKRRTRGKTHRIEEAVTNLLRDGRLVETSGPRRARLIALKP